MAKESVQDRVHTHVDVAGLPPSTRYLQRRSGSRGLRLLNVGERLSMPLQGIASESQPHTDAAHSVAPNHVDRIGADGSPPGECEFGWGTVPRCGEDWMHVLQAAAIAMQTRSEFDSARGQRVAGGIRLARSASRPLAKEQAIASGDRPGSG